MAEPGARARTRITVPRVEFDLGALFVGMIGVFAHELLWRLLAPAYGVQSTFSVKLLQGGGLRDVELQGHAALKAGFWSRIHEVLQIPYLDRLLEFLGAGLPGVVVPVGEGRVAPFRYELPWWQVGTSLLALLLLWSIVGGALARMHAVRIARDESLAWDDGFAFSFSNLRALLAAPLFALAAAALFAALTAAAGAVVAIPWAGPLLQIVLLPLAMLSGLVVTIILLGAVFGVPLIHAALAAERNGTLDAVSRTYSYAFTRPVLFVAGGTLVLAIGTIIGGLGAWFMERATLTLVALGTMWSEGADQPLVIGYGAAANFGVPADLSELDASRKISAWVAFAWSAVGILAVRGFVLSYVVGGLTDLYFLLREEVDGTPRTEVHVDDGPELDLGDPVPGEPRPDRPRPAASQGARDAAD